MTGGTLKTKAVRSVGALMPCLAWATPEVGLNPSRVLDFVQDYPAMSLVWGGTYSYIVSLN